MGAVARQFWRTGGYRRQCLVTPDGGLIALDWFCCCDTDSSIDEAVPILMVFHGLTGKYWFHGCSQTLQSMLPSAPMRAQHTQAAVAESLGCL